MTITPGQRRPKIGPSKYQSRRAVSVNPSDRRLELLDKKNAPKSLGCVRELGDKKLNSGELP
jgi:hypothetical protein